MNITFDETTHTYTVDGTEVPSVTTVCRFLSYDQKSDRPWLAKIAADNGTRIHAACALLDYGEEPEEDADTHGYLLAYRRFLADYRPEWAGIETITACPELGLAGTVDRFGWLYDGIPIILDIKTGAKLHNAPLRAQLTGYQRLLSNDAQHNFHAQRLLALQLRKDGTYVLQEVQQDDALLNACLHIEAAARRRS